MSIIKLEPRQAGILWNKLSSYDSPLAVEWRRQCLDNRKFYEGDQYTTEELEKIAERGQYNIVINKIRKAVKGLMGLVSSAIPKYKLVPVGASDEIKASLGNQMLDWVWGGSEGLHVYRRAIKSALVDNLAFLHVVYGRDNKVKFVNLEYDDVIVDPVSKDPMFSDAEMIVVRKYLPVATVKKLYGMGDEELCFEIPRPFYDEFVKDPLDLRHQDFLSKVYSHDNQYVHVYECYRKEYGDDPDTPYIIVKETVLGYMHMFREELPKVITEYPIVPLYVEGYSNPYKRGEVHFLKDLQRFLNKVYGVTILNAQLSSNPKAFVRQRDIPRGNLDEFQETYNKPGSINVISDDGEPPIIVHGQPLNNAFFNLYMDAKQEFEYLTMPAELLGYTNNNSGYTSSSSLLEIKENTLDSMKDFISIIEMACSRLGLVSLQYVQAYVGKDKLINITDMEGRINSIEVNKKQGLDVDNDQSVAQFIKAQEQNEVPEEEIQAMLAKAKEDSEYMKSLDYVINETDFSMFDVRVVPGSYSPTYMMSMLRLMMELVQTGSVDPSVPLDYIPAENKAELKERFDTIKILNGQVASLEEELEMMKRIVEDRNKKLMDSNIGSAADKAKLRLDKTYQEVRIKHFREKALSLIKNKEQKVKFEKLMNDAELAIERDRLQSKMRNNTENAEATGQETLESLINKYL